MKRVLMTGDTVGGVWTFTLELAAALAPYGTEVTLATMGRRASKAQRDAARRIPNLHLVESSFKLEWMEDPWSDIESAGRWLLDLEQSAAPQIVHLNTYAHGALPWSAPVVLTAHSCVISWWQAVKGETAPACWNRYRAEVARGLKAAALVTAPSQTMLSVLENCYGLLPNTRVVHNGCDPSRFRRGPKQEFILCAGRLWDEAKNAAALCGIAGNLSWPVYVAGETGGAGAAGCRALGRLSAAALADWYSRTAIYALPALYEPFGLSALEAAFSGCALVLGNIASLREIWQDAALYVPPREPEVLGEVLQALIDDEPLRRALAEWGYQRAHRFAAERMARQYLAAYQEAAEPLKVLCA